MIKISSSYRFGYKILHTCAAAVIVLLTFYFSLFGLASDTTASNLTLSPAIHRLTIEDFSQSQTVNFFLTNTSQETLELQTIVTNIDRHDPIGRPILSPDADELATSQLEISPQTITLFPDESTQITATIHPEFLKPGSNYLAVMFQHQPEADITGQQIIPAITGLVHVRNPNGEDRRIHLTSTNLPRITTTIPDQISIEFDNPGNTDITPYGDVLASSKVHGTSHIGHLNQDSHPVYPQQNRRIQAIVDQPPELFVIDSLTFSIIGHDLENSVHFDHHQQVVYISPAIIAIVGLMVITLVLVILNRRLHFIKFPSKPSR